MKKKILWFTLSFTAIHCLLLLGYDALMAESALMSSDRQLQNLTADTDVLIAGHSHALALETTTWPKAFNIAGAGEELHQSCYKVIHAVEALKVKPKSIVFPLDLGGLAQVDVTRQNYQGYWNKYEDAKELSRFSDRKIQFWSYRLTGGMMPYKDGLHDFIDFLFAGEPNLVNLRKAGKDKINQQPDTLKRVSTPGCYDDQFSPYGWHYLKKLTTTCERNGIKLIFLRFPVTESFYLEKSLCYEPDQYYREVKDSLNTWGKNHLIVDFHNTYSDELFRDPHHLEGGEVREEFTRLVRAHIEALD